MQELIIHIRELHRLRKDLLKAQTGLTLRIKAICRRAVPETDKHAAGDKTAADKLYKALLKGESSANDVAITAHHLLTTRTTLHPPILDIQKQMIKAAKQLPVVDYVNSVKGFSWIGLAQIIGETGDLSNYSNPGKLWRRLGLAPYNGKSPRELRMKRELTAADWMEVGYSPQRRSTMFVVGEALIKHDSYLRELYYTRKEHEQEKAPELTKMAWHMRAHRYMEKRLLKELWQAWNATAAELDKAA